MRIAFALAGAVLAGATLAAPAKADVSIKIDLSEQTMVVKTGLFRPSYKWKVSTARKGHETPTGTFRPQYLVEMHYSKLYHRSPMPHSIFFDGDYAIHGTGYIKRLGQPASHGCVRLHPDNAKLLYDLVTEAGRQHTTIRIVP